MFISQFADMQNFAAVRFTVLHRLRVKCCQYAPLLSIPCCIRYESLLFVCILRVGNNSMKELYLSDDFIQPLDNPVHFFREDVVDPLSEPLHGYSAYLADFHP